MKSFHDLLFNRRSIRKYTDEEIAADDVKNNIAGGFGVALVKGQDALAICGCRRQSHP